MNKVPKCKPKFLIPHQNNIKISQKESFNEHLVPKITQRNLKFSGNRNFGKDISNSIKNNVKNINNNQSSKVDSANDKKSNNNIYIKKHSSASQVAQKTQKIKIAINDKKLRENKSGAIINKKNDISINKDNYKIMNTKKEKENININVAQNGSKLHSSISFGVNNEVGRPFTGNPSSIRVPSQKSNRLRNSSINKISISKNINNNNNNINNINNGSGNNKKEIKSSNMDLM
jgi:hypothetical protein